MGYLDSNLFKNEEIVYMTNYHWIIYFSLGSFATFFLKPIISQWTSQFAVTTKRVVIKTGSIARNTFEMNLHKIESIHIEQSILGRILNYGDVHINGSGGGKEIFHNIRAPIVFRKNIQRLSF